MRQIVDGLRYDTDTADVIAEFSSCNDQRSAHYYTETMYRTPRGRWFLHGEGNALSPYNRTVDIRSWAPGERIVPQPDADAFAWLCRHGRSRSAERYFPDMVEDA